MQEQPISSVVETMDTTIFFYGDISLESAQGLNQALYEVDCRAQAAGAVHTNSGYEPTIDLHIQSGGGSLINAFSILDTIARVKSKVNTYVEGGVASAGTLITCVGDKRFIGPNSYMLIHQLSAGMEGKFADLTDSVKNSEVWMDHITKFYADHTKINPDELPDILSRERWFNAQQCIEMGLADEIL
tara:strand:- start:15793 stop:16353 length:561 start_codon:yes stop_codon:yes gene_type:complete